MKGAGHPMGNSDGRKCWGAVGFVGSCSTWKQPVLFSNFLGGTCEEDLD